MMQMWVGQAASVGEMKWDKAHNGVYCDDGLIVQGNNTGSWIECSEVPRAKVEPKYHHIQETKDCILWKRLKNNEVKWDFVRHEKQMREKLQWSDFGDNFCFASWSCLMAGELLWLGGSCGPLLLAWAVSFGIPGKLVCHYWWKLSQHIWFQCHWPDSYVNRMQLENPQNEMYLTKYKMNTKWLWNMRDTTLA